MVKVILDKSKVVKGNIEGSRGQISFILFMINKFICFLLFRKDPFLS